MATVSKGVPTRLSVGQVVMSYVQPLKGPAIQDLVGRNGQGLELLKRRPLKVIDIEKEGRPQSI